MGWEWARLTGCGAAAVRGSRPGCGCCRAVIMALGRAAAGSALALAGAAAVWLAAWASRSTAARGQPAPLWAASGTAWIALPCLACLWLDRDGRTRRPSCGSLPRSGRAIPAPMSPAARSAARGWRRGFRRTRPGPGRSAGWPRRRSSAGVAARLAGGAPRCCWCPAGLGLGARGATRRSRRIARQAPVRRQGFGRPHSRPWRAARPARSAC